MTCHQELCVFQVPIFNHLDEETLQLINSRMSHQSYQKGEALFSAGDPANVLYIVHSGMIKIFRITASGKEQLIRVIGPGDFIGVSKLFNPNNQQENYAEIIKDAEVCILNGDILNDLLIQNPSIGLKLLSEMSERLSISEKQTTYISTEHIGSRLALYLADLATNPNHQENVEVDLGITRKDLASYLGTTPESISRKFKELEENGLITQKSGKKIVIHKVEDLIFYTD